MKFRIITKRFSLLIIVIPGLCFVGCSTVGKHEAFLAYKANATEVKSETDKVFTEALKLDLNNGLKMSAAIEADIAADAHQALKETINKIYTSEFRITAIKEGLEKVQGGEGKPSELVDNWIEAVVKARANLQKAEETGNSTSAELQKLAKAVHTAEGALANKVHDLHREMKISQDSLNELKKQQAELQVDRNLAMDLAEKAISAFNLDIRGTKEDPWRWGTHTGAIPSSLQLKLLRTKVLECMTVYEEYCDLLAKLANPGLIDEEKFNQSTTDLNESLNQLLNTDLNVTSGKDVGIISAGAISAAKIYIDGKRVRQLQSFLESNQEMIGKYSGHMQKALVLLRRNLDQYYNPAITSTKDAALSTGEKGSAKRAAAISNMFAINSTYVDLIEAIKVLDRKLSKLAKGHSDLTKAIIKPSLTVAYIDSAGAQFGGFVEDLKAGIEQNEYNDAQFIADASERVALEFEDEYALANAETVKAKAEYDIAKAASDANPEDLAVKKTAEELQKKYLEFKAKSDLLKIDADYYRSLHTIDKTQALRIKPGE